MQHATPTTAFCDAQELSQADFARLQSVSRKTVSTWKQQGYIVFTPGGLVDVPASNLKLRGRPDVNRGGVTRHRR